MQYRDCISKSFLFTLVFSFFLHFYFAGQVVLLLNQSFSALFDFHVLTLAPKKITFCPLFFKIIDYTWHHISDSSWILSNL